MIGPTPWKLDPDSPDMILSSKDIMVAAIFSGQPNVSEAKRGTFVKANRRLIVMAPQMLDALERYIELSVQMKESTDETDKRRIIDQVVSLKNELVKILKKAKGY